MVRLTIGDFQQELRLGEPFAGYTYSELRALGDGRHDLSEWEPSLIGRVVISLQVVLELHDDRKFRCKAEPNIAEDWNVSADIEEWRRPAVGERGYALPYEAGRVMESEAVFVPRPQRVDPPEAVY